MTAYNYDSNARAEKAGLVGILTDREWASIVRLFGNSCAYCEEIGQRFHLEHVVPISRGGDTVKENVVPACRKCNLTKGARTPKEWLEKFQYDDFMNRHTAVLRTIGCN